MHENKNGIQKIKTSAFFTARALIFKLHSTSQLKKTPCLSNSNFYKTIDQTLLNCKLGKVQCNLQPCYKWASFELCSNKRTESRFWGMIGISFCTIRSDEGLTLETSAFRISVRWPIYIINSVDKTKFLYTTSPPTQHHSFFRNYPFIQSKTQFYSP